MLHRSYIYDQARLARVEAHAARVQANPAYQAEMNRQRSRVPSESTKQSHAEWVTKMWMAKINRIDAMGSNPGWST